MSLILHELGHVLIFCLFYFFGFYILNQKFSFKTFFLGLFVSIFMDIDHLFDYFLFKKSLNFNLNEFLLGNYFEQSGKVYVLFHSWEYVFILAILFIIFSKNKFRSLIATILVGILCHLIYDTLSYGFEIPFYFLISRIYNGFTL